METWVIILLVLVAWPIYGAFIELFRLLFQQYLEQKLNLPCKVCGKYYRKLHAGICEACWKKSAHSIK